MKHSIAATLCLLGPLLCAQAPKNPKVAKPIATVASVVPEPAKAHYEMERFDGSSMQTELGYGIKVNKRSELYREWFVLKDLQSPATLDGPVGISVSYKSGDRYSGEYRYSFKWKVTTKEPVTAVELRVHVMDVFGRLLKTLSATEVENFSGTKEFEGVWRIWSENEASEAFASVAYIAQVRTANGRVYEVDRPAVFEQVRKVAKKITEADLEPKREEPKK